MATAARALILLATLAQFAFAPVDGFSVKRTPKEGVAVKYSMTTDFDVNGGRGNLIATISERVVSVDKDGNYTVEQKQLDASGKYNDEKIDVPARPDITVIYKPNGQVSSIKGGELVDAMSYRMENLGTILDPGRQLNVGDLWVSQFKADKVLGTVDAKAEYKLLAEEKIGDIDTLKIKGTIKEADSDKPATNDFTEWISKDDGSMVQLEAKWSNAPFPGITYPVNATIKMSRIVK